MLPVTSLSEYRFLLDIARTAAKNLHKISKYFPQTFETGSNGRRHSIKLRYFEAEGGLHA
jgi:hypothetical protein